MLKPGSVDMKKIRVRPNMNKFEIMQNHQVGLEGARAFGAKIVNIGSTNLYDATVSLCIDKKC